MSTSSSREVCFLAGRCRRPRTAPLQSMRSGASGSLVSIWSSGSAAACASARASAFVSFLTILVSPALVAGRSSNADDPASRLRIGPSVDNVKDDTIQRSEEHTSELQSLMRHSYAVFRLKKKKQKRN